MKQGPGEWSKAEATRRINADAASHDLTLSLTLHAKDRMRERGLIMADVMHVLKRGFVHEAPEPASRDGYHKYCIETASPNSQGRTVRIVVIPGPGPSMKIVTVMWRDEK